MLQRVIFKGTAFQKCLTIFTLILLTLNANSAFSQTGAIEGFIIDKKTNETLIGASVTIDGSTKGTVSNVDGLYRINGILPGKHFLSVSFMGYLPQIIEQIVIEPDKTTQVNVLLDAQDVSIDELVVSAKKRTNTEATMLSAMKASIVVTSSISNQQIQRSQDRDASEVIRRVPGITIIGDRFIIVRGLNQRYNNVWLNNAATPSSETDVKAFSFDVIPSSLIDNILIFKTSAPEYPADFTGGFVKITTKNMPENNFISIDYATSYRSGTTFNDFYRYKGGKTDWLGFDDGTRDLPKGFPMDLENTTNPTTIDNFSKAFNKNWVASLIKAKPDQRIGITFGKKFKIDKLLIGSTTSIGYSNSMDFNPIDNNSFNSYNVIDDEPVYKFKYNDNQYTNSVKVNALSNWSFNINKNNVIEIRNLFNQNAFTRTVLRSGYDGYSQNSIRSYEYRFMSRTTYSGQIGGKHALNEGMTKIDWNLGYSIANRQEPDRKVLQTTLNEATGNYQLALPFAANPKQAGRLYLDNKEHILSNGLNVENKINIFHLPPTIKVGYYAEYRSRRFNARNIGYIKGVNYNPTNDELSLPFDQLFIDENFDYANGITIDERTNKSDSYSASNTQMAGYMGLNLPFSINLNFYGGVRAEYNKMLLSSYLPGVETPIDVDNHGVRFFPSANLSYNISQKSLLRFAYGQTINRPEFREIAPFIFYDFNDAAGYSGNPDLKDATVNNFDIRFERYPSSTETFSLAVFYKSFNNPIEMIYVDAGSGLQYSFNNAKAAKSMGLELELRKSFENTQLFKNFSVVLNASLISSKVIFPNDQKAKEKERPMFGQSPYIINAGIYYQNPNNGWMVSVLYNVIGKRIIVVGQRQQDSNDNIPDIYEMPNNLIDITISKKIGKFEIKAGIKDLLNEKNKYQQTFSLYNAAQNTHYERTLSSKEYKRGTVYTLGVSLKF
ncbi:MAG: TonB-dependent receptor [Bacteroidales bacterium]|nr:MAG: TonB-dependent receptor [Bacteroidales bacterium]